MLFRSHHEMVVCWGWYEEALSLSLEIEPFFSDDLLAKNDALL